MEDRSSGAGPSVAKAGGRDWVRRAVGLQELLMAEAAAGEAAGGLTEETVSALRDSGLLAMWMPREFGGAEVYPVDSLRAIEALSHADGSTGWVVMAAELATARRWAGPKLKATASGFPAIGLMPTGYSTAATSIPVGSFTRAAYRASIRRPASPSSACSSCRWRRRCSPGTGMRSACARRAASTIPSMAPSSIGTTRTCST